MYDEQEEKDPEDENTQKSKEEEVGDTPILVTHPLVTHPLVMHVHPASVSIYNNGF